MGSLRVLVLLLPAVASAFMPLSSPPAHRAASIRNAASSRRAAAGSRLLRSSTLRRAPILRMVASLADEESAPLQERLSLFYGQYSPEKLPSVAKLAEEYAGQGEAELNQMLLDTYGADLTTLAASSAPSSETPAAAAEEEVIEYKSVKYLTKKEARAIDEELMDEDGGWPLEALMELAGKSVADAIYDAYPPKGQAPHPVNGNVKGQVLILCGKGNNGGDGLVAARHLKMYGYDVQVVYPERKNQAPYRGLIKQLQSFDVRVNLGMPGGAYGLGLIVDCAFGFSYKKPLRAPWDVLLKQLTNPEFFGNLPKVSVDVPLGWDVNRGPDLKSGLPVLQPDMLISLTAPKGCAISFKGQHYLGGRFIPYRMNIARQLGLFNAPYQGTSTFVKLPDQAPTSARSEFLKRLVAEGDEEEEEEEKVPAPAAAAAVVAAPAAATATAAAATGGVPDLAVDDVAEVKEVKEVWRPPVWPEPNENIRTAIADMYGEVDAILGEKREGWPAKLRQLVTTQLVPLGWESDYPPDRTTVSKVLFLASKTLYEKDFNNQDLLSEGRTLAERAFEDEGDLEAGKMLKAYAALYAANGDEDAEQMILDDFARIIKTKGYPEDLVPVPTAPEYGFKDKWTISILEPPAMGGEAIEVMVRPKQKFRVLANAWLKMKDLTEENLGDYEFVVPEMPKTWRSGKIDLEDEIGDTGILDGNGFSVVITNPDVEMALMSAQA